MSGNSLGALRVTLWALVAVAIMAVLWFVVLVPRMQEDAANAPGRGDYQLQIAGGGTFTEASLHGAPSAVFFGFTHCPEVCPTTLGDILTWKEALGPGAEALKVFFVTVDPERDTPGVLHDYVSWVPGVSAVTGSRAETDKALAAFRIYARRVELEGGDYTMDHSAGVMLFDRNGNYTGQIPYQEDPQKAEAKLQSLIESS